MDNIKEKLYQQLAIDIVAQFQISRIIKIILQNIKSGKAGDNLKNLMSAS